jgi:hypothetical protein
MTLRSLSAAASLGLIVSTSFAFYGCGLGSDMDVGNDKAGQNEGPEAGASTGGVSGSTGGVASTTGGVTSAGGTPASSGGVTANGGSVSTGGSPSYGTPCGRNTCGAGLVCCNASCGTCVPPGYACDMIACEDPGPGVPCGKNTCASDQICCSPSCGICGSKGGACPAIACNPDPVSNCTQNSDCRIVADYCTGCDCRALGPSDKLPACSGAGVECLRDPCDGKAAVCKAGVCVAQ